MLNLKINCLKLKQDNLDYKMEKSLGDINIERSETNNGEIIKIKMNINNNTHNIELETNAKISNMKFNDENMECWKSFR